MIWDENRGREKLRHGIECFSFLFLHLSFSSSFFGVCVSSWKEKQVLRHIKTHDFCFFVCFSSWVFLFCVFVLHFFSRFSSFHSFPQVYSRLSGFFFCSRLTPLVVRDRIENKVRLYQSVSWRRRRRKKNEKKHTSSVDWLSRHTSTSRRQPVLEYRGSMQKSRRSKANFRFVLSDRKTTSIAFCFLFIINDVFLFFFLLLLLFLILIIWLSNITLSSCRWVLLCWCIFR